MKSKHIKKDHLREEIKNKHKQYVELEKLKNKYILMEKALKKANSKTQILQQFTQSIHSSLDIKKVFQEITDKAVFALGYTTALILAWQDKKKIFETKALTTKKTLLSKINKILGFSLHKFSINPDSELNSIIKSVMNDNIEVTQTLSKMAYPLISKKICSALQILGGTKNYILLPLKANNDVVGGLFISSSHKNVSEEEITLLKTFTHVASNAIKNAHLHKQTKQAKEELHRTLDMLRKSMRATIQAVAMTVETRDPYTAGHQQRVADLARSIAKDIGLSKDRIDGIRMAGLIHDIGKIKVPAEILSKTGQLTKYEYDMIKTHPQVGHNILKQIEFPWPVAKIVLQHHERMDGTGYPSGLSGKRISMEARILAVADVVEAMASHRPYRPALGIDKALDEIIQNKGVLYDSDVADVCVALFKEKNFKFRLKDHYQPYS